MTKQEIIKNIEEMNYSYNEETVEAYSFWREAVKKVPEFVKQDIASLRKSILNTCAYDDELPNDFSFSKKYAKILRPLNLDITIDEE